MNQPDGKHSVKPSAKKGTPKVSRMPDSGNNQDMRGISVVSSYMLTILFCFLLSIILMVFHLYMN